MKTVKSLLLTLVCAAVILAVGYGGIILSGEQVLESPSEPERIIMTGNLSNLFYSRLEDDIVLYPWNYYTEEEAADVEDGWRGYMSYDPYRENNVLYTLIAMVADVDHQVVSRWYDTQNKTILGSIRQGIYPDGNPAYFYFYQDRLSLEGQEYEVKLAVNDMNIISFSCIPVREEGIQETEEWAESREKFRVWIEKNSSRINDSFASVLWIYNNIMEVNDWYLYTEMLWNFFDETESEDENYEYDSAWSEELYAIRRAYGLEDSPIQMIELKDSILLLMEGDITVGLYYDVLKQRIIGFHLFFQ